MGISSDLAIDQEEKLERDVENIKRALITLQTIINDVHDRILRLEIEECQRK